MKIHSVNKDTYGTMSFVLNNEDIHIKVKSNDTIEIGASHCADKVVLDTPESVVTYLAQNYGIDNDDKMVIGHILDSIITTVSQDYAEKILEELSTPQTYDNSESDEDINLKELQRELQIDVVNALVDEVVDQIRRNLDLDKIKNKVIELCRENIDSIADNLSRDIESKIAEEIFDMIGKNVISDLTHLSTNDMVKEFAIEYLEGGINFGKRILG